MFRMHRHRKLSRRSLLALPPMPNLSQNPFHGSSWLIDAARQRALDSAFNSTEMSSLLPTLAARSAVRDAYRQPTAFWLSDIASISEVAHPVLRSAAAKSTPELVTFVVYNLPHRDCNAAASAGELCCAPLQQNESCTSFMNNASAITSLMNCSHGLAAYEHSFIRPLAALLTAYERVPTVLIIEPDSLPNLVTGGAACRSIATRHAYRGGISLAIEQLAPLADAVYLDAAHGGCTRNPVAHHGFPHDTSSCIMCVSRMQSFGDAY